MYGVPMSMSMSLTRAEENLGFLSTVRVTAGEYVGDRE